MQVLDKGQIGLLQSMGSDRTIAQAAWVSYGNQEAEKTDEEVKRLINYLMKHRHGTPFESVVFQFYVKCPIFVAREWMRHRIGSFNEISGRYVKFKPEFYLPEVFRVKGTTNKQGSIIPDEAWAVEKGWQTVAGFNDIATKILTTTYEKEYSNYLTLLEIGVANEQARMILPVALYTQFWWTVNLRALLNFVSLRSADNAQWEIRQYSNTIETLLKEQVPYAYQAFEDNGRNAP